MRGVPSDWQAAMNRIRAESVRGHLSFLASDVLEGRATPSRGLDVAAEYIASQFRRAGLEEPFGPAGGYFQPLELRDAAVDLDGFECRIHTQNGDVAVSGIPLAQDGIQVDREPILPASSEEIAAKGAVVVFRGTDADDPRDLLKRLGKVDAKLLIVVDPTGQIARTALHIPPSQNPKVRKGRWLFVPSFPDNLAPDARITVKAKPMAIRQLAARNVAGLLRGSDPALRDTYIVVSAHYDHIGMRAYGPGDRIFNGANDDASGVTGVLEIAATFAQMPERPKRSILFVTFAGEEDGLLGSREFVRASPVPLEKIVADVNFEHLGRPDADGTSYVGKGSMTGIDFTTIGPTLIEAGRLAGVEFIKHEKYNEPFFAASDNLSFAQRGIPSLTVCNGFLFPEYHAPGDEWQKIDAVNMAGLVRALALGVLTMANDPHAPQWNEVNEKTGEYRKAR